jgi:hypothetical protein
MTKEECSIICKEIDNMTNREYKELYNSISENINSKVVNMTEEESEALSLLKKYLNEGKENVGVLLEKFDTKTYTLVHSYSKDIKQISTETFRYLSQHNYLLSAQCTKVGCRWFYEFTKETQDGFSLYKLFTENDFPFLKDKKFYIVPRGKSTVYFSDSDKYDFTKIKDHATILSLNDLFYVYCNRRNGFMYKTYCTTYATVGWNNARRKFVSQNSDKDIEQKNGDIYPMEKYAKDFDLLTIDKKERYKINFSFNLVNDYIAPIGSSYMTEEDVTKEQNNIANNKNNFFVTFSIKQRGGSMFHIGTPYYAVNYIEFNDKKPFEEYV